MLSASTAVELTCAPDVPELNVPTCNLWLSATVLDSTAFEPYKDKELKLNDDEKKIVDQAMPIYESLYKFVI